MSINLVSPAFWSSYAWTPMSRDKVILMMWLVIYEYEVPGGYLNYTEVPKALAEKLGIELETTCSGT